MRPSQRGFGRNSTGSGLRGVDLEQEVAQSTVIQRRRWTELYHRLWERKAKLDIADTILFAGGSPAHWFFTSAATGEVTRKKSSSLGASSIRHRCIKATTSKSGAVAEASRHRVRARLVHEKAGQLVCSLLRDGEICSVLTLPPTDLAATSVLLQPLLPSSRQPPHAKGTFVAKYNVLATALCTRVLHLDNGILHGLPSSSPVEANSALPSEERAKRPSSAPPTSKTHQFEDIVKRELLKLVQEVEAAFRERVRLLTADFQISATHRLVLVRVSGVVFFSDLVQRSDEPQRRLDECQQGTTRRRKAVLTDRKATCAGRQFCHCSDVLDTAALKKFQSRRKHADIRQITRKSISLSDNETAFLKRFGADAEATLRTIESSETFERRPSSDAPAVFKLLERRIFMLQNTMWNPKSHAFDSKACVDFRDAKWLSHEYEVVQVCAACYLIYQAIDDHRFDRSREIATATSRRPTTLCRPPLLKQESDSTSISVRAAWMTKE